MAVGVRTHCGPGQLLGCRNTRRDSQQRRGGLHRVGQTRAPAVHDHDDDGKRGVRQQVGVIIGDSGLQLARPFRGYGTRYGACGPQRGRRVRILLRAYDEDRRDSLGRGKRRKLGTEGEGSGIGGERQDRDRRPFALVAVCGTDPGRSQMVQHRPASDG